MFVVVVLSCGIVAAAVVGRYCNFTILLCGFRKYCCADLEFKSIASCSFYATAGYCSIQLESIAVQIAISSIAVSVKVSLHCRLPEK